MKRAACLALLILIPGLAAAQQAPVPQPKPKYVIVMVGDGMGLSNVTAARIRKNGIAGPPLWMETLEHIGYARTYSEKNTIADSAAAASALACGEKFVNSEVCLHTDGRPHKPTLLELAKARGMGTGLVVTKNVTDATPAAFAAHVKDRGCEQEIARQYMQQARPDVLLGGGRAKFVSTAPDRCGAAGDFLAEAVSLGYAYATTAIELQAAVARRPRRLLGLFAASSLTPEYRRSNNAASAAQPRLPDMASAALSVLEKDRAGFFLMIEGSQIDLGNHEENYEYQYAELVAFDETVKRVLDWIDATPERRRRTLLIITADHDTGGFALLEGEHASRDSLGQFTPGWAFSTPPIARRSAPHTGADVPVWSRGPGSPALNRVMDNTWIYAVAAAALK